MFSYQQNSTNPALYHTWQPNETKAAKPSQYGRLFVSVAGLFCYTTQKIADVHAWHFALFYLTIASNLPVSSNCVVKNVVQKKTMFVTFCLISAFALLLLMNFALEKPETFIFL